MLALAVFQMGCQTQFKRAHDQLQQQGEKAATEALEIIDEAEQETALPLPPPKQIKIGLILGPGLAKTYAHVGVLQELVKARMPLHAVVGLGFGSLPATFFALTGQPQDVEWKMGKLNPSDLPGPGLLDKSIQRGGVSKLNGFLTDTFQEKILSQAKLKVACPSKTLTNDAVVWSDKGKAAQAIKPCLAVLPYFEKESGRTAALSAIIESRDKLVQMGANFIVYVDVLGGPQVFSGDELVREYASAAYWSEVRGSIGKQALLLNDIIPVDTNKFTLTAWNKKRELMLLGIQAGRKATERMSQKYGF